jgi:hypothetical protein
MATKKATPAQLAARARFAEMARSGAFKKRKAKPAAKQTTQRKANPIDNEQHLFGNKYATIRQQGDGRFVAQIYEKVKTGIGEEIDLWGFKIYKTQAGAQRYLDSLKPSRMKNNPAAKRTAQRKTAPNAVVRNPIEKRVATSKLKANFPYLVEYKNTGTGNWNAKAAFTTLAEAKNLAYMFAEQNPNLTIRVVRFTGGPM